jgi:hypothetical protein
MQTELKRNGNDAIAFFGFADQNAATARLLTKNQIPALNKDGMVKIGFKIDDAEKFKSLCSLKKPTPEQWQNEITRIKKYYEDSIKKTKSEGFFPTQQWEQVHEILWNSYELADNFAEMNAIVFARLCNDLLDIHLSFFLYSDMYRENLFLEESQKILRNLPRFNLLYNRVIREQGLDIPLVTPNHVPFWYNCTCGMKLGLEIDDSFSSITKCPLCNKEYELDFGDDFQHLFRYYHSMDFTAVSRNIAMAHGLGDTLFISGFGGSLQYGQISDLISNDLGFHHPVSLGWRSRDYYIGMFHKAIVHELMKSFNLKSSDFIDLGLQQKITNTFDQLSDAIQQAQGSNNQKDTRYLSGMQSNVKNLLIYAKKIFSLTSSFLDIIANQEAASIVQTWEKALSRAETRTEKGVYLIHKDINYNTHLLSDIQPDYLSVMYTNIQKIEVE